MSASEVDEVKKWFRGFRVCIKNLNDKINFYNDLIDISMKMKKQSRRAERNIEHYTKQIEDLEDEVYKRTHIIEECLSRLDEKEQNIITVKYMNGIGWDYISMHTFLSKSQAVRVHNRAMKKLAQDKEIYKKITEK